MSAEQYDVEPHHTDQRLDVFITNELATASRSQVQSWIADGRVRVNDTVSTRASRRLVAGDTVHVNAPQQVSEAPPAPEKQALHVVYEDDHLLVVNKARGVVVHPGAGNAEGTLVNGLLHHRPALRRIGALHRPGIVHRLDKDTSGLLVVAGSELAFTSLTAQFKARTVQRRYIAFVQGTVPNDTFTVDVPIGRDAFQRQKMGATATGKPAITHFTVMTRYEKGTKLQADLVTGRTHQIRVHAAYTGHPVIGDTRYGAATSLFPHGQALHAAWLALDHPASGERFDFAAPLPTELHTLEAVLARG